MEELLGTTPKPAVGVERAVLGLVLLNPDEFPRLVRELNPEVFYKEQHRRFWKAMASSYEEGILPTLEGFVGTDFAPLSRECVTVAAVPSVVDSHIETLKGRAQARAVHNLGLRLVGLSHDGGDSVSRAQEEFHRFVADIPSTGKTMTIADVVRSGWEYAKADAGISTGFVEMDDLFGKMPPGSLSVIFGMPGFGKTLFALSLMRQQAKAGIPVGYMSLEVDDPEIGTRIASSEAQMRRGDMRYRARSGQQDIWERVIKDMEELPGWFCFDMFEIGQVVSQAMKWADHPGIKILFIDNLQDIATDRQGVAAMDYVVHNLKAMARRTGLCVFVLGHFNRQFLKMIREGQEPGFDAIRDSGRIEQVADRIFFLLNASSEKEERKRLWEEEACVNVVLKCKKNRVGPGRETEVALQVDYNTQDARFVSEVPF